MSLLEDVQAFVDKFGARPGRRTKLGIKVARVTRASPDGLVACLVEGLQCIHAGTEKKATRFLQRKTSGKCVNTSLKQWAANLKSRGNIKQSELSQALDAMSIRGNLRNVRKGLLKHAGNGSGKREAGSKSLTASKSLPAINVDGAVPVVKSCVPHAPQSVVNWIYQALLDCYSIFARLLGEGSFDEAGVWQGSGSGQLMLFWGSHLGAVRGQSMISWDYDGDLAVFLKPGASFDTTWQLGTGPLLALGYRCTKHGPHKYRIAPPNPMCWIPYKELFQQVRENDSGLNRSQIMKQCAALWRKGVRSSYPHGSNCIDIEVYTVPCGKQEITIQGTAKIAIGISSLFPAADAIFGPLRFTMPRTTDVLTQEYGQSCVTEPRVKTFTKGGVMRVSPEPVPLGVRLHAWPYVELHRVDPKYWS